MRSDLAFAALITAALIAWTMIEEFPVATAVVAALGAVVWWRVRRNEDGDPVPEARVVRPEDRAGADGDPSQPT